MIGLPIDTQQCVILFVLDWFDFVSFQLEIRILFFWRTFFSLQKIKRRKYQEMHVLLFWTNQFFTLHHLCLKGDRFPFWPFDNIKLCTMPSTPLKMRKGSSPLSTCTKYFGLKKQNKLILNNKENNTSGNTTSKKSIFQISYM